MNLLLLLTCSKMAVGIHILPIATYPRTFQYASVISYDKILLVNCYFTIIILYLRLNQSVKTWKIVLIRYT